MSLKLSPSSPVDAVIDALPAQIAIVDTKGTIRAANRSWRATAAVGGLRDPAGGYWNYLDECRASAERGCAEAIAACDGLQQVLRGERAQFVMTYPCPFDGRHHWYQLCAAPVEHIAGGGAVVMHTDVTSLQRDVLTGLANRAMFEAQLQHSLALASRYGTATGLVLLDLDGFKLINDAHGHSAGDALLIEVASRLNASVRDYDLVARLGGDEFAVVPAPTVAPAQLTSLAQRLCTSLADPFSLPTAGPMAEGCAVTIGASVGVALFPDHGADVAALLAAADAAVYTAKRGGRNQVALATTPAPEPASDASTIAPESIAT